MIAAVPVRQLGMAFEYQFTGVGARIRKRRFQTGDGTFDINRVLIHQIAFIDARLSDISCCYIRKENRI